MCMYPLLVRVCVNYYALFAGSHHTNPTETYMASLKTNATQPAVVPVPPSTTVQSSQDLGNEWGCPVQHLLSTLSEQHDCVLYNFCLWTSINDTWYHW